MLNAIVLNVIMLKVLVPSTLEGFALLQTLLPLLAREQTL